MIKLPSSALARLEKTTIQSAQMFSSVKKSVPIQFIISAVIFTSTGTLNSAQADGFSLQPGIGMTSFTSGRQIPSAYLGLEWESFMITGSSTGYRTRYDYLSGYTMSGYAAWDFGTLLGIMTRGGFGLGVYQSRRGYRATLTADTAHKDDFGAGPAIEVTIYPFNLLFLRIETVFGLGHANNAYLIFQEISQLTLGLNL